MRRHLTAFAIVLLLAPLQARAGELDDAGVAEASLELLQGPRGQAEAAAARLIERNRPDVVASLILGLRYRRDLNALYRRTFEALTGEAAAGWYEAMLWQERHPEVRPHASYRRIKLAMLARIDTRFLGFFATTPADKMRIRLEEDALIGPAGERLGRLPGHVAYWFAWDGYMGVQSSLYPDDG